MARTTNNSARWMMVAAFCLIAAPAFAGHDEVHRYLTAAVRLYHNLENERALEQVQRAKQYSNGIEDDVAINLTEGVILSDMGRLDDATAAFRTGLLLDATATLPMRVSPKIQKQFEALRTSVQKELAIANAKRDESERKARERAEAEQRAEDAKRQEAQQAEDARRAEAEKRAAQARLEMPPPPNVASGNHVPAAALSGDAHAKKGPKIVPMALGGAAVVAAAVGAFYGITSNSQYSQAKSATFQDDRVRLQGQAQGSATAANVLYAVAGAAAIGAVVTFVIP